MPENIPVVLKIRTSTLYGVMNGETREIFVRLSTRAAERIMTELPRWNVCLLTRID